MKHKKATQDDTSKNGSSVLLLTDPRVGRGNGKGETIQDVSVQPAVGSSIDRAEDQSLYWGPGWYLSSFPTGRSNWWVKSRRARVS